MAITPTLRFLLKQYGSGGDPHPNRAEFNEMIDALENNAAMFSQGITTARPAAGKRGRFYYDETVDRLYYDNGAQWKDANPNGGGGAGAALAIGGAGSEGTSARAARADHKHPLPLATAVVDGAMPKADKAKLDAATASATAGTVVLRDASGRTAVGTPTSTGHATNKSYVDGLITETANFAEDIVDATRYVCTAATRPTGVDRYNGQEIYETDTKRTRIFDGAIWQVVSQPYVAFTPTWSGFAALGSGYARGGSYAIIGPDTVRATMWLRAGTAAALGAARLSVSLPVAPAGYSQQFGDASILHDGPGGPLRRAVLSLEGSGNADVWAWPDLGVGVGVMQSPGESGYPFKAGSEIHVAVTYQCAAIA